MPVLALISGMQAGLGPLSRCHSGVPALQHSQSRHIPFVSAQRSLFTFHRLDIPIRGADYLLATSFSVSLRQPLCRLSSPSSRRVTRAARPCLSSSFSPFVFLTVYLFSPHPPSQLTFAMTWRRGRGFTRRRRK